MARFLSEEWFTLVRTALSGPGDLGPGAVAIRHRVTGGSDGDVDYVVRAGSGRFSIEPGAGGPVDVEIVQGYDCAAAISQGRLTPTAALATGRIQLEGDASLVAARGADFVALGDLLAPVRAVTTY